MLTSRGSQNYLLTILAQFSNISILLIQGTNISISPMQGAMHDLEFMKKRELLRNAGNNTLFNFNAFAQHGEIIIVGNAQES